MRKISLLLIVILFWGGLLLGCALVMGLPFHQKMLKKVNIVHNFITIKRDPQTKEGQVSWGLETVRARLSCPRGRARSRFSKSL